MEEKYSFKEFLTKETYIGIDPDTDESIMGVINKIEIPMIQRDYAQGRIKEIKGEEPIIIDTGSRFLKSIFNSLKNDVDLELEFIYGSVEERPIPKSKDKEYVYIPLDGQQRLTTLYLLYWYLGMRELYDDPSARKELLEILSKFTYLTRTSSRIFCECICDWGKMGDIQVSEEKPSTIIENRPWFYKEYKKDPTVKAMLAMLDHINMLYETDNPEGIDYLPRLERLKFYAFPLNKYKLTEDLYIKMNARGKQLTGYENFKADLINWMKNKENPDSAKFEKVVVYRNREMKYYMAFAQKMDNEWTDIFWNALKDNDGTITDTTEVQAVDLMFMRFFLRFFFNERILHLQRTTNMADEVIANDEIVKYFYGENGNDANVIYNNNDFEDKYIECLSYDMILKIERFLDTIKSHLDVINREFVPSWQKGGKVKEDSFYSQKISWQARIVFQATFKYFTQGWNYDETNFCDWMRIVWNFVVDPTIRNIKDNIGTLKFVDELSAYSEDIITYLSETPEGSRLKTQFAEEHIKAQLIKKDSCWREQLVEGEKHPLLKGRILFLLPDKENTDLNTFTLYRLISNYIIPSDKKDYLWIRAILSQLVEFNIESNPLTLSDIRENWKTIINDSLIEPTQTLLKILSDYVRKDSSNLDREKLNKFMIGLCNQYQQKEGLEWVYPLVSWIDNGQTLLSTYSDSRRIEARDGNVYLCYKTTLQSDSCILLTSMRDIIISQILPYSNKEFEWIYTSYHCNIHDRFFRGMKVTLFRDIKNNNGTSLKCCYVFDPKQIEVGIRYADNPDYFPQSNDEIWVCNRVFDISNIVDTSCIQDLIDQIENVILNLGNNNLL